MDIDDDKAERPTKSWNKQEKKSNWLFYVMIGVVCFMIAWAMSGTMK